MAPHTNINLMQLVRQGPQQHNKEGQQRFDERLLL